MILASEKSGSKRHSPFNALRGNKSLILASEKSGSKRHSLFNVAKPTAKQIPDPFIREERD